jgi:hypothetical protein
VVAEVELVEYSKLQEQAELVVEETEPHLELVATARQILEVELVAGEMVQLVEPVGQELLL